MAKIDVSQVEEIVADPKNDAWPVRASKATVCVIAAAHLSTCPRMLKVADALTTAGYRVRVVSARHTNWAVRLDEGLRSTRTWEWDVVDHGRSTAPQMWLRSGVRFRAAGLLTRALRPHRAPLPLIFHAWGRVHSELLQVALTGPADLFYGGTNGGLSVAAMAGRRAGRPYALDLEDFHTGELEDGPEARFRHTLIERIERSVLPGATFLTAAGAAIADAYKRKYGVQPIPVNNTFPLPPAAPDLSVSRGRALTLYWFSQTIGPRRGLEDVIHATAIAQIPVEMHLRGNPIPGYVESLIALAKQLRSNMKLVVHTPATPDSMIESCAGYDAGLALEPGFSCNNKIASSNKLFTYLLAGLPVILTDTEGQRAVAWDLEDAAFIYQSGDVFALAAGLRRWSQDKTLLSHAKVAAWNSAKRRWHWDHPLEKGAMLAAIARTLHI